MSLFLALALAAAQPTPATGSVIQVQGKDGTASEISQSKDPLAEKLDAAFTLIKGGNPAEAIRTADAIIAAESSRHAQEKRLIFSARTLTQAIIYAGLGASQKKSAVVLDGTWSAAYFVKGFALIDLNRAEEAKAFFDKAIALSPMDPQYLSERGEWFKARRDWAHAYADFQSASTASAFAADEMKSFEQRRAWRGVAFARIEQGNVAEARELLRKCLELDASDEKCRRELEYVNARAN